MRLLLFLLFFVSCSGKEWGNVYRKCLEYKEEWYTSTVMIGKIPMSRRNKRKVCISTSKELYIDNLRIYQTYQLQRVDE